MSWTDEGRSPRAEAGAERAVARGGREPIAIIGMGCRLPGADSPEALWELLLRGGDAIREIPSSRWDVERLYDPELTSPDSTSTRWAGTLERIDHFEPAFFGLSSREAAGMDPQQRLVLEVAWEALERAALNPRSLAGSRTGVFVGASTSDYLLLHRQAPSRGGTGIAPSIIANRLSHLLDLRGPSMVVDTFCSSSLVAVDLACQSLLLGASDMVIAGGVNALLAPTWVVSCSQAGMMARDGRCKTFDASADGYVRSEGCGLVVLKRLADALASGDPVLAVILGSATNQDGRTPSLTAPNGLAQQSVIRDALARAGVKASEVGLVEAHGTGTALGDETEVAALHAVLSEGREPGDRCLVGSVKANIGHLEAGAGVAGLMKAVLVLRHEVVPPQVHLRHPNPRLRLEETCLRLTVEPLPWRRGERPRLAGVSSFGIGGTNAHVILQEAPPRPMEPPARERPAHLVALSARTESALSTLAGRLAEVASHHPDLAAVCHSLNVGRARLARRAAVHASERDGLVAALRALAEGRPAPGVFRPTGKAGPPRVGFLFTGQGSQWPGMGWDLYQTQPVFRAALERCDRILRPHLETPLLSLLEPGFGEERLALTQHAQPALVALEFALAETWRAWGIQPVAVLGHSLGEFVAACVAGAMDVEQMLPLVAERARLMGQLPPGGTMALVSAGADQVREVLAGRAGTVTLAALNAPALTVISGPGEEVSAVLDAFEDLFVFTRPLRVSHAFHSSLMEPMLEAFERTAQAVSFRPPRVPLVSNLTGAPVERLDGRYWRQQIREPVRFMDGLLQLAELGCDVLLEVGPSNSLVELARKTLAGRELALLPSLQRERPAWATLSQAAGCLYARGAELDWARVEEGQERQRVELPTYPFERQRCWLSPEELAQPDSAAPGSER